MFLLPFRRQMCNVYNKFARSLELFTKSSRSLSPEIKTRPKTPKLDVNKFKDIKKNSQECEIRLQHLYGLLKEEINSYKVDDNSAI